VAAGAVVFADWLRGFGNLLVIDHGDDFLSVYGNNESLLAAVGASVKSGEAVATVGNSGGNPDSGLYFELRHRGQPFDPLKWARISLTRAKLTPIRPAPPLSVRSSYEQQAAASRSGGVRSDRRNTRKPAFLRQRRQGCRHGRRCPIEELRSFADVYNAIKQGYVEPVEDKKLITHAISGMLANLDPHSAYLDADAFKDLQVSTQGEFGGLGIEVGMEDGFVKVVSPIEDTPAFRAGFKPGDLIIKLDDTPVKGLTLNDAVKKMRGKPKTQIRLTVVRKGETKPFEVTLTREKIKVQSVKSKLLEGGFGYLRVTQFQEETTPTWSSTSNGWPRKTRTPRANRHQGPGARPAQ
jgi:hypothetical protein